MDAVGEEGAKVIFLLRLAPVFPYGVSNYIYGVTGVRYIYYIAATMAGLVPVTLLYAYLGTLKRAGEESPEGIQRVALGLARTFQTASTFTEFTVREQITRSK